MRLLDPQQLTKLASNSECCTQVVLIDAIDFSRPFIHEEYTQLYYTDLYEDMTQVQRLCYNQLFAVRTNEFIMMLERDFVDHILVPLLRHKNIRTNVPLSNCLQTMIEEEQRHYAMFLDLNRRSLPSVFGHGRERFFSKLPLLADMGFILMGALAQQLTFPLWFLMAMEESSIILARRMFRHSTTRTLGELEPSWVKVHREHSKDEARHLHIDRHIIDACIAQAGRLRRRLNAVLFQQMLHSSIATPKRSGSGLKVILQLMRMCPELQPRQRQLEEAVLALRDNSRYMSSLFNREAMPVTFTLFDETPELHDLSQHMVGYKSHG